MSVRCVRKWECGMRLASRSNVCKRQHPERLWNLWVCLCLDYTSLVSDLETTTELSKHTHTHTHTDINTHRDTCVCKKKMVKQDHSKHMGKRHGNILHFLSVTPPGVKVQLWEVSLWSSHTFTHAGLTPSCSFCVLLTQLCFFRLWQQSHHPMNRGGF